MADTKENGGPAFPRSRDGFGWEKDGVAWEQDGMSLRDYFAAKAMQGMVGNDNAAAALGVMPLHQQLESLAAKSYVIADAMLKARG